MTPIQKKELREQLLLFRKNLPPHTKQRFDSSLQQHLLSWIQAQKINSLGIYWPIQNEPDLFPLYTQLHKKGITLALPVIQERFLHFALWVPNAPTEPGAYQIPIPISPHSFIQPQALLIPSLGFTPNKYRLGYGGGFYDRTLQKTPRPITIGIAYQETRYHFTNEAHDIPLDIIITERGLN
jgi:5,10-methenyltetrahydrofolate synthetase